MNFIENIFRLLCIKISTLKEISVKLVCASVRNCIDIHPFYRVSGSLKKGLYHLH
ncbi:MAG: hypothetical protein J6U05_07245 [Neisseriaceae bacterium]|nr:hypothetical protein [Neisseriaceae bacterium]